MKRQTLTRDKPPKKTYRICCWAPNFADAVLNAKCTFRKPKEQLRFRKSFFIMF